MKTKLLLLFPLVVLNSVFGSQIEITTTEYEPTIVATAKTRVNNVNGPANLLDGSTSTYWDAGDSGQQDVEIRWKFMNRHVSRVYIYDKDPSVIKNYYIYGSAFTPVEGGWFSITSGTTTGNNVIDLNLGSYDVRRILIRMIPQNSGDVVQLNYVKVYQEVDYLPTPAAGSDQFSAGLESVVTSQSPNTDITPGGWVYITATIKPSVDITKDFYLVLTGKYKSAYTNSTEDYTLFQSKMKPSPGTSTWLANQSYTCTFLTWIPRYAPPGLDIDCLIEGINGDNRINVTQTGGIKTVHVASSAPVSYYGSRSLSKFQRQDKTVFLFNGKYLTGRHIVISQRTFESIYTAFKSGYDLYVMKDTNNIVGTAALDNDMADLVFEPINRQCNILLAYDPDAVIMPAIMLRVASSYVSAYPNDRAEFPNGTKIAYASAASDTFLSRAEAITGKIIRDKFSTAFYSNHIIGYELWGQSDGSWKWWCSEAKNGAVLSDRNNTLLGADVSPALLSGFRSWLSDKYVTDAAFQAAWNTTTQTLNTAEVDVALMIGQATSNTFNDPSTYISATDYIDYKSERMNEVRDALGNAVKTEGNFIVQAHSYGPVTPIFDPGYLQHGEGMSYATIASENIDSQGECHSYYYRKRNDHYAFRVFNGSMQVNNHVAWTEHDNRTFLSNIETYKEYSKIGTIELNKMYFGADLCLGMAQRYLSFEYELTGQNSVLWNSDYNFCSQERNNAKIDRWAAQHNYYSDKQVAVIISYKSSEYYDLLAKLPDHNRIHNMLMTELNRTGIPYDLYHLEDIDKDRLKNNYVAYIFLNCDALTTSQVNYIKTNYQKDNNTLIWFYAPAYIDPDDPGYGFKPWRVPSITEFYMTRLSGVNFSTIAVDYQNSYWNSDPDIPEEIELQPSYSNNQYFTQTVSPVFSTKNDTGDIKLGYYLDENNSITSHSGLSVKQFATWTSVFCGLPYMPRAMLRRILLNAGCHRYSDNKDVYINASRQWLVVRNLKDTGQTVDIILRNNRTVWDVYAKQKLYDSIQIFNAALQAYETKLYYIGSLDVQDLIASLE